MSTFDNELNNYKKLIENELKTIYLDGPKLLRDPINYVLYGGKRLRPALCMMTAKSLDGNMKNALQASISIELLHIFSLVHDDIMDNDSLRHGRNTIHDKWSIPIGILAGDAILALAFNQLNKLDNTIKERFNSALIAVCEGQALDLEFEKLNNINIDQYITMIDLKTSHIIGLCLELGAIISNCKESIISHLKKYGQYIGRAFQIQDDLLEITSNSDEMGKDLDSDILLNKKTFLTIKAYELIPNKVNKIFTEHSNNNEKIIILYKKLLIDEGIVELTQKYINKTLDLAKHQLNDINLKDDNLYSFINYMKERQC